MKIRPLDADAVSLEQAEQFERFIVEEAAPEYITHHIIITLARKGSARSFNLKWGHEADAMSRLIINALDEAAYSKRQVPELDRYSYLLRGETVKAGCHSETHLHWHMAADFSDPRLHARMDKMWPRFKKRLRAAFRRKGINIQFECTQPASADRNKVAEYIAKAAWIDVDRFYRR